MRHDEFARCWNAALARAGFSELHRVEERLDPVSMDRYYELIVDPPAGQQTPPFYVTAKLSYRWCALLSARSRTTEEDLLRELLGDGDDLDTARPWLRVDIELAATLPWGEVAPVPSAERLARWVEETTTRLDRVERLLPEERVSELPDGRLAILAWQGEPMLEASCHERGALHLTKVSCAAWQAIDLPRQWDDPDRDEEPPPDVALARLFANLRGAMFAWMEALDHLLPADRPARA